MTEETKANVETPKVFDQVVPQARPKAKRNIIHFSGERPTAINLEHLTVMYLEGKRINFEFYTKMQFVDFADEDAAKSVFQVLMNTWSGDGE